MRTVLAVAMVVFFSAGGLASKTRVESHESRPFVYDWVEKSDQRPSAEECKRGLEILNRDAKAGKHSSYAMLGTLYEFGPCVKRDTARAYALYEKELANGTCIAEYLLGILDLYGDGVPEDRKKAIRRFRIGALCDAFLSRQERNNFIEGILRPRTTPRELRDAIAWSERLSKQNAVDGYQAAKKFMGADVPFLFWQTLGGWAIRASSAGSVEAEYDLGIWHLSGHDGEKCCESAIHWLNWAAAAGHAEAQKRLGQLYALENREFSDPRQAYIWLRLAEINGVGDIAAEIRAAAARLSDDARALADYSIKHRMKEWRIRKNRTTRP